MIVHLHLKLNKMAFPQLLVSHWFMLFKNPSYVMVRPSILLTGSALKVKCHFIGIAYCWLQVNQNSVSLPFISSHSFPTLHNPETPQSSQRAALQQTDGKPCTRSSTDRCRRRGSQPTAWSSLSPTSACEYLLQKSIPQTVEVEIWATSTCWAW